MKRLWPSPPETDHSRPWEKQVKHPLRKPTQTFNSDSSRSRLPLARLPTKPRPQSILTGRRQANIHRRLLVIWSRNWLATLVTAAATSIRKHSAPRLITRVTRSALKWNLAAVAYSALTRRDGEMRKVWARPATLEQVQCTRAYLWPDLEVKATQWEGDQEEGGSEQSLGSLRVTSSLRQGRVSPRLVPMPSAAVLRRQTETLRIRTKASCNSVR